MRDQSSDSTRQETETRTPATRIDPNSVTFRWLVPAALLILLAMLVILIAAVIAVALDLFPV